MEVFENVGQDHLVGSPDNDIARCDLDSRIASLEWLAAARSELHADMEFVIVTNLSARALSHAGVTDCFNNLGPANSCRLT